MRFVASIMPYGKLIQRLRETSIFKEFSGAFAHRSVSAAIIAFICLLALLIPNISLGAESLRIKIQPKKDYIRILFYCKQPVGFTPEVKGSKLLVHFDRPFETDSRAFKKYATHFSNFKTLNSGKLLSVNLSNKNLRARPFVSEGFVGLDLITAPLHKTAKSKTKSKITKLPKAKQQPKKIVNSTTKTLAKKPSTDTKKIAKPEKLKAAAPKPTPPITKNKQQIESTVWVANRPATATGLIDPFQIPTFSKRKRTLVFETAALTATNTPTAILNNNAKKKEKIKAVPFDKDILADNSKLVFAWQEEVAAASFLRGEYLWIVFSEPQDVNLKKIIDNYPEYFSIGEQIDSRHYTILRFKLKKPTHVISYKEGNNWLVVLSDTPMQAKLPFLIDVKTSKLQGSRLFIKEESFVQPLRLIDPEVGDELVIVPSFEPSHGLVDYYKYSDYRLLTSAQGLAIQLIADNVAIKLVRKGIEIAGPTNRLSAESWLAKQKELERKKREANKNKKEAKKEQALFKFRTWMRDSSDKTFIGDVKELKWAIVNADWDQKNNKRVELAQFYFTNRMYAEALGVLTAINNSDADVENIELVKLLKAASMYMMHRYKESTEMYASVDYSKFSEEEREEAEFWKNAAILKNNNQVHMDKFINKHPLKDKKDKEAATEDQVELTKLILDTSSRLLKMIRKLDNDLANSEEVQTLEATARFVSSHYQDAIKRFEETEMFRSGDEFEAEEDTLWWNVSGTRRKGVRVEFPFLEYRLSFLREYPGYIYNHLGIVALEEYIRKNDLSSAEQLFTTFVETGNEQVNNDIEFLRGLFYAKDEESEKAIKVWAPLTENVMDRFNRARAQFALTGFLLRNGKLSLEDAINRFNSIRIVWRGDVLELNLLRLLGEFYMDRKEYMKGFKVWRQVITNFPGSEEALLIARKMSEQFVYLFNGGGADDIPQLEALTLFFEFRELTPIGKRGDQIIQKLADRLIEVDLLDRAAALLTHQVRFRLTGAEKNESSTRLAEIHMLNNRPQRALDALNATQKGNISPELELRRKYLKAKALILTKKNNKALKLLRGDDSHTAAFLRGEVYWNTRVWYKVIEELEQPFKEIVREEKLLDEKQSEQVVRLAVAYALTGDQRRLMNLYEDFVDYIPDTKQREILSFVALDKGPVRPGDLESTIGLDEIEGFLGKYLSLKEESKKAKPDA